MIEKKTNKRFGYIYEEDKLYREDGLSHIENLFTLYKIEKTLSYQYKIYSGVFLKNELMKLKNIEEDIILIVLIDPINYIEFKKDYDSFVADNIPELSNITLYFSSTQSINNLINENTGIFDDSSIIGSFFFIKGIDSEMDGMINRYHELDVYSPNNDYIGVYYIMFKLFSKIWLLINPTNTFFILNSLYTNSELEVFGVKTYLLKQNIVQFTFSIATIKSQNLEIVENFYLNQLYKSSWYYGKPTPKICDLSISSTMIDQNLFYIVIVVYLSGEYSKYDIWIYNTILIVLNQFSNIVKEKIIT